MKNEGPAKVILASPPIGVNKSGCVLQPCGVIQLFNTIGNLEGVLTCSFLEHLEAQNLPKVLGQRDVFHLNGINKQTCHLMHVMASVAATHSGDQEALVGVPGSIIDKALHCLGKEDVIARGGDSVALALHALALADDGAKVLHGMGGSAAGMVPFRIAAEYKHLTFGQLVNPVGGNAVGIISPGIGATHRHLLLTASLGVKVTVHTLVVGALGRTVAVPCVGCTHNIVVKLHDMVDGGMSHGLRF